jgi:hypothetical protein
LTKQHRQYKDKIVWLTNGAGAFQQTLIDKPLTNLIKIRRGKTQINKIRNEKGELQQTPRKSRESSETPLKTSIQINWKI